jgi:hypothetical protein
VVGAAVAVTAVLYDGQVGESNPLPLADPAPLGEPPAVIGPVEQLERVSRSPTATTIDPARPAAAASGGRRFAWAPVARASGYHVELFRGSALVFRAETTKPEILIRARWRLGGKVHRLQPGEYRWYVWPRVAGRREAKATVRAALLVPRG